MHETAQRGCSSTSPVSSLTPQKTSGVPVATSGLVVPTCGAHPSSFCTYSFRTGAVTGESASHVSGGLKGGGLGDSAASHQQMRYWPAPPLTQLNPNTPSALGALVPQRPF